MAKNIRRERLAPVLGAYAERAIPDDLDLRSGVRRCLQDAAPVARRGRGRARPVVTGAAIALLVALGLGAGALLLGGGGPSTPAYPPPPTPSGFVQVRDGYTVTVQPVDADGNRIVLTATVRGGWFERNTGAFAWPQQGAEPGDVPHLTSADGTDLPWIQGRGDGVPQFVWGRPDGVPGSVPTPDATAYAICESCVSRMPPPYAYQVATLEFDTSHLAQLPTRLNLHLVMDVGGIGESYFKVAGPFRFDFSMPVDPRRRIADVHQTVVGTNSRLTLDRVVVTPSGARAYLRFAAPDTAANAPGGAFPRAWPAATWQVQPGNRTLGGADMLGWAADNWIVGLGAPLLNQEGAWTLAVHDMQGASPTLQGPWVFQFTLPPLGAPPAVATAALIYGSPTPLPGSPTPVLPTPVVTGSPPTLPLPRPSDVPPPGAAP